MSGLSGIMEPKGIDIITDLKKTLSNKIFSRAPDMFGLSFISLKIKPFYLYG